MITKANPVAATRAAALFVSGISATIHPTRAEVEAAIRTSLRTHGGGRGCAADVAAAYGDYPELAAGRMRWARDVIDTLYPRRSATISHLSAPARAATPCLAAA
jgi:hypothetical protein